MGHRANFHARCGAWPWRTHCDRRITPNMTHGPIDKIEAARLQLQCAIRILDSEDVAAHTLAYAAYCLLRDLLDLDLRKLEDALNVRELPEFLKHAKSDPQDVLKEHSPETAHLTITLAILLWKMNNQEPTDAMREFDKRRDPYEPDRRHSEALKPARQGSLPELKDILTPPSTGGNAFVRGPRRIRNNG